MELENGTEKIVYETMRNGYRRPAFLPDNAVATGYIDLDYQLGGLRRGETYLLVACASMEKTALGLNLIEKIAVEGNMRVAMFSLQYRKESMVNRLIHILSSDGGVGCFEEDNVFIDDTASITVDEMRKKLESWSKSLDLIIIDYLQLLRDDIDGDCLLRIRKLAQEKDCPVLILYQLSDKVDKQTNCSLLPSALGEKHIEAYVDNILFLNKDGLPDVMTQNGEYVAINIEKNSAGKTGTVLLLWLQESQRYCTLVAKKGGA